MKAHRYRLIFWPLFYGAVVYCFAGQSDDDRIWPGISAALVAVAFALGAIYSSDGSRRGSALVRVVVMGVGILAMIDLIAVGYMPDCDWAILLLLAIFAFPMLRATIGSRTRVRSA